MGVWQNKENAFISEERGNNDQNLRGTWDKDNIEEQGTQENRGASQFISGEH